MAVSDAVMSWTLQMPAGSLQQYNFDLTVPGAYTSTPWPLAGVTWEYVARPTATDDSTPLIEITTVLSTPGLITVTSTATLSQVLLAIYPAATAALAPGTYYHALWANPGAPTALPIFTGLLQIAGAAQP